MEASNVGDVLQPPRCRSHSSLSLHGILVPVV